MAGGGIRALPSEEAPAISRGPECRLSQSLSILSREKASKDKEISIEGYVFKYSD